MKRRRRRQSRMLETLHSVNFFVVLSLQLSPPYLPYRSLAPLEA
jgi:hypothetical protein